MVITSAASMNGYLSKNASIIVNGHRKTLPASMPIAAICDYDILRSAPKYMTKAGIGDSMCFFSCWFDWLLSHLLLGTDYDAQCFEILMPKMTDFVGNYQNYVLGEDELLKIVVEMLLLSGASMVMAGSSNPASQSEHLIAHSYSMRFEEKSEKVLHGLQIATTTLTSAKIQEELVVTDQLMLRDLNFNQNAIADFYGAQIASECQGQFGKKSSLINQNVRRLNQELATDWPDYCQVLSRILFSEQNLRQIFQHFDIATGPGALGIEYQEYNEVVGYARFIRDRFTCLDL
jgi:glycerol-1-phosphate dehydrogenase [NAD(P)+]